jgi:hypothetical protein
MAEIQLADLTKGEVRSLSGQERGVAAREHYHVDALDRDENPVIVQVPDDLDSMSPSFIQGMFSLSIRLLGPEKFREHYVFDAPPEIIDQVNRAITNTLIDRRDPLG